MDELRAERLIERYFDGVIAPVEREALNRMLASDPDAARLFARAARMESALEQHFRAQRAEAMVPLLGSARDVLAETPPATPSRIRRMLDHAWGPSLAVLAHAALLLILLRWVLLPAPRPAVPFPVTLRSDQQIELDPHEPIALPEAQSDVSFSLMTLRPREPEAVAIPPPAMSVRLFPRPAEQVRIEAPPPMLPDWYAERTLSARRQRLLPFGRAEADSIDEAAEDALAALARRQRPDGSWSGGGRGETTQVTAFAVLAFLSRGHLPGHPLYGPAVEAGLRWLIDPPASADADPLAADALALAEAYAITRIPSLAGLVRDQALRLIEDQREDGGWRGDAHISDLAATTWRIHALVTAHGAGISPDHIGASLRRAIVFVQHAAGSPSPDSRPPDARAPPPRETLDLAAAWRALQLVGEGGSAEAQRVERRLRRHLRVARADADSWSLLLLHESALALAAGGTGDEEPDADIRFVLRRAVAGANRAASPLQSDPGPAALAALALGAPYRYRGESPAAGLGHNSLLTVPLVLSGGPPRSVRSRR